MQVKDILLMKMNRKVINFLVLTLLGLFMFGGGQLLEIISNRENIKSSLKIYTFKMGILTVQKYIIDFVTD